MNNLRDRRRRQTARDIQQAALRVVLRIGYGAATTDAIAAEAQISPRTFFNYYPNKQAAILGQPPKLDRDAGQWFETSDQPLVGDILRLLAQMLGDDPLDRTIMSMIKQVVDRTPELLPLFRMSLDEMTQALSDLLLARLGPDRTWEAMLIAELSTHALSNAVHSWVADDRMTVDCVLGLVRQQLDRIGALLVAGVKSTERSCG